MVGLFCILFHLLCFTLLIKKAILHISEEVLKPKSKKIKSCDFTTTAIEDFVQFDEQNETESFKPDESLMPDTKQDESFKDEVSNKDESFKDEDSNKDGSFKDNSNKDGSFKDEDSNKDGSFKDELSFKTVPDKDDESFKLSQSSNSDHSHEDSITDSNDADSNEIVVVKDTDSNEIVVVNIAGLNVRVPKNLKYGAAIPEGLKPSVIERISRATPGSTNSNPYANVVVWNVKYHIFKQHWHRELGLLDGRPDFVHRFAKEVRENKSKVVKNKMELSAKLTQKFAAMDKIGFWWTGAYKRGV